MNYLVLDKSVNTIRFMAMDTVKKANSGHLDMPMGHILYDQAIRMEQWKVWYPRKSRSIQKISLMKEASIQLKIAIYMMQDRGTDPWTILYSMGRSSTILHIFCALRCWCLPSRNNQSNGEQVTIPYSSCSFQHNLFYHFLLHRDPPESDQLLYKWFFSCHNNSCRSKVTCLMDSSV